MQGFPNDIRQWTAMTSRIQLRQVISNLSVPQSILQPYIVRKADPITTDATIETQQEKRTQEDKQHQQQQQRGENRIENNDIPNGEEVSSFHYSFIHGCQT